MGLPLTEPSPTAPPPPLSSALQVSVLTSQIDRLFLRCFAGLEVEVEAEETMGGRQQQPLQGEGGRAAAAEAPPPPPPPPHVVERFDSGLTEAQFGELGRTRPKVGPRVCGSESRSGHRIYVCLTAALLRLSLEGWGAPGPR